MGRRSDNLVLEGIRYGLIEQLCRDAGIPFELRRITRDEVFGADELLLSPHQGSSMPAGPSRLETAGPAPSTRSLYAGYQRAKEPARLNPPRFGPTRARNR